MSRSSTVSSVRMGVYILRKFFGVVLLAISVKFITKNLIEVIAMVQHGVAALGQ